MNTQNFGFITGRLTRDVMFFTNSDGSKKAMVTIAAKENYKNKDGQRPVQFVSLEGFISNKSQTNGAFDYIHKGDLVQIAYTLRSNNYIDKNGEKVYAQVLFITDVTLMGTKKTQTEPAVQTEYETAEPIADYADELPFADMPIATE